MLFAAPRSYRKCMDIVTFNQDSHRNPQRERKTAALNEEAQHYKSFDAFTTVYVYKCFTVGKVTGEGGLMSSDNGRTLISTRQAHMWTLLQLDASCESEIAFDIQKSLDKGKEVSQAGALPIPCPQQPLLFIKEDMVLRSTILRKKHTLNL